PHRCELGVLGRGMPGASRIGRQTQIGQDPSRRPVADRRTGHRRDGRGPHQRHHLSRGTLPTPRPSAWEKKALVAIEHSILVAVWHMLTNNVDYHDLGGDYFARLDPERAMRRIIRQANSLGFTVRFDPIQAPNHPHDFDTAPDQITRGSAPHLIFGSAPYPSGGRLAGREKWGSGRLPTPTCSWAVSPWVSLAPGPDLEGSRTVAASTPIR